MPKKKTSTTQQKSSAGQNVNPKERRDMRISWLSNAPWIATGYGVQTKLFANQLIKDRYEVECLVTYGYQGPVSVVDGIRVRGIPGGDFWGNTSGPKYIKEWISQGAGFGVGITLMDVWVLTNPEWASIPLVSWTPIDHKFIPELVRKYFAAGKKNRWCMAMSKFGYQEMLNDGFNPETLLYAPHAYDGNVFKPASPEKIRLIRKKFHLPEDAHLTFINAANKGTYPIRKCFPEMIYAWSAFAHKRKDAFLFMNTEMTGKPGEGVNILKLLENVKPPLDRVLAADQKEGSDVSLDEQDLADLYAASDVLLFTSRGEGFGVPAIESQASGTPVISTNWTAQTELNGSGWLVEGQVEWDHLQTGWWKVPNVDEIYQALESSYEVKGNSKLSGEYRQKAINFAAQYEVNNVYNNHWKPALNTISGNLNPATKAPATVAQFDKEFKHHFTQSDAGKRWKAFRFIAEQLLKTNEPAVILETGCVRLANNWSGDGQSTILWDWIAHVSGGSATSIDIDEKALAVAKSLTRHRSTTFVQGDSVKVLPRIEGLSAANLVYLDSYDVDHANPMPSAMHHLLEISAVFDKLKSGCLIAIDDCINDHVGKHLLVQPYLKDKGCELIFDSYIKVWRKK